MIEWDRYKVLVDYDNKKNKSARVSLEYEITNNYYEYIGPLFIGEELGQHSLVLPSF